MKAKVQVFLDGACRRLARQGARAPASTASTATLTQWLAQLAVWLGKR